MSYILDALRRADAERERGRVPGIHAHVQQTAAEEIGPRRVTSPWRWLAAGVGLGLLLVVAGWWWLGREPEGQPPTAYAEPPPIPQAPAVDAPPAQPPAAAAPEPQTAAARPAEPPLPPIEQRPTSEALAAARRAATAPSRTVAAGAPPTPVAVSTPTAPASAPTTGGRIYARHELPAEIRRELPAVNVGGSIYSPNAANRFVIVNGQVVHEGGQIGPDHVLESIRLKSAVLRFKGYRYEILF